VEYDAGMPRGGSGTSRFPGWGALFTKEEKGILDKAHLWLQTLPAGIGLSQEETETLIELLGRISPQTVSQSSKVAGDFPVLGVVRGILEDERHAPWEFDYNQQIAQIWFPLDSAEGFYMKSSRNARQGFERIRVIVDSVENLKKVTKKLDEMHLYTISPLIFIEMFLDNARMVFVGAAAFGVLALVLAALGISKTMVMNVVERTREIGIMKAVGATDLQVQALFLIEGAALGLFGGLCGLLLGWMALYAGRSLIGRLVENQSRAILTFQTQLVVIPVWLAIGVPALAGLVAMLGAVYPARRAARVNPITALRHE
jgi:putative ABC transport system permease protein